MSDQGLEIKVDFYGLRTLTSALRQVAPDLLQDLEKTTREPMNTVRNHARRLVSTAEIPSGWRRSGNSVWSDRNQKGWDNSKVRGGIQLRKNKRTRAGVVNLWTLYNYSPAGAIYEFAKSPEKFPQGTSFVRVLNRQPTSRLIWRAWDESGGDDVLRPAVIEAINEVSDKFNKRALSVEGGDKIGIN